MKQVEDFATLASAYEGVEQPESFGSNGELEAYRESVLLKTDEQADFIERELQRCAGSLIEVGCGNGRLAMALAQRGAIDRGLGLDLSSSRIDFARAWASDLGLGESLSFEVDDATSRELGTDEHGLAVCITGALGYLDAYVPGSSRRLLAHLRDSLTSGGLLVLELYPFPRLRRLLDDSDGHIRTWLELPAGDPWRFYLSDYRLEPGDVLVHGKTFVHRTDGSIDEGRCERLVLHTPETISQLLLECGFSVVRCFEGWSPHEYRDGELLVVTATAA
ncbi:MAG TPA: class I SAM-dependent methyltransferase [Solirubrobacteraceae bacterium]|nr:class I SAM-dependent methyltransferase [Solirubrobacteraceae bacterium]